MCIDRMSKRDHGAGIDVREPELEQVVSFVR